MPSSIKTQDWILIACTLSVTPFVMDFFHGSPFRDPPVMNSRPH